jgi:hypothetical protein
VIHEAFLPISPAPQDFTREQLARSLGTFGPVFPQARGLRHQSPSGCTRFSRVPTTMPHPTPSRALGFRWALAYLLSTPLTIPEKVSRVHNGGRKPDDVGGVLLTAPSALCSSPVPAQGRQVDLCNRSHNQWD